MSDLSQLTPDQMLALSRLRMLGTDFNAFGAQGGNENVNAFFSGVDSGDLQRGVGSLNASIPFDGGALRAGMSAVSSLTQGGNTSQLVPNVGVSAGPFSANYGQVFQNGERAAQQFGGGVNFGPAQLNYTRSQADRGPSIDAFNVSIPTEHFNVQGGFTRGKGVPTTYQGGFEVPGLLGGNLSVAGEYTPDTKDKSIFARYRKSF